MNINLELNLFLDKELIYKKVSDPLVKAFHYFIYSVLTNDTSLNLLDVTGTNRASPWAFSGYELRINSERNDDSYGPVVGTGTDAVTINDYALKTKITHGTGAGQMEHGKTEIIPISVSGYEAFFNYTRPFTNKSGSSITVNEVGLYVNYRSQTWTYLFARDVISGGVSVLDGKIFTVNYKMSVSVA